MSGLLDKIDPLDIDDFLIKIENSYEIKFIDNELQEIKTFGDLVKLVNKKISLKGFLENKKCTSQYLFNSAKRIILEDKISSITEIKPKSDLNKLFPLVKRKRFINTLENKLNLKIDGLRQPYLYFFAILFLFFLLIFNFFAKIIDSKIIFVIIFILVGLIFSGKYFSLFFKDKTLGQLIKRIEMENYINSQKESSSFNPIEVEINLKNLFAIEFDLEKSSISSFSIL